MKVKTPSYVTIVITSLSGATVRRVAHSFIIVSHIPTIVKKSRSDRGGFFVLVRVMFTAFSAYS